MPEPAFPAFGLIQLFHFFKLQRKTGNHHQLSDTLSVFDPSFLIGIIVKCHLQFSSVISVHHTHAVGRTKVLFCSQTASCKNTTKISLRNGCCHTGSHHYRGMGSYHCLRSFHTGIQVIPSRIYGTRGGKYCIFL